MVNVQNFDAAEFFNDETNLPTIFEGDEQVKLVASPNTSSPDIPEPNWSNDEEPNSNTTTPLSYGTSISNTDKTVVEVTNVSLESPIGPISPSRLNTSSEKGSRSKNKNSFSSPTSHAGVKSNINRVS